MSSAGLPGKRGQKGARGEKGIGGLKGKVGPKGFKGETGIDCNTTQVENIHKENQKLKKKLHFITNYTRNLERDLTELKTDHEILKNLTYSYMGGRPCLVDVEVSNGGWSKPAGSFVLSGSDLTLRCNEGFVIKNVRKTTCQDGKFSVVENIGCIRPRDCNELKQLDSSVKNEVYTIYPHGGVSTQVFCDMISDKHAWTVISNRYDGSVDFARSWSEYLTGFGNKQTEYR